MGPPERLLERIVSEYGVGVFIETGTYRGETAAWASRRFRQVITIENFKSTFEETRMKYGHLGNVRFLHGHSALMLPELLREIKEDAVFWLDAHWMGSGSYGENDECPVMDELRALNRSEACHFIFIDDARLFLVPPPLPHHMDQWPTIGEVIAELARKDRYTVVEDDVIISVPGRAREFVGHLIQDNSTVRWRSGGHAGQSGRGIVSLLRAALRKLSR